jgi:hypothetical protein
MEGRFHFRHGRQQRTFANLSRYHPDFGQTPQEHADTKAKREAGHVPFTPKADLRARRERLL